MNCRIFLRTFIYSVLSTQRMSEPVQDAQQREAFSAQLQMFWQFVLKHKVLCTLLLVLVLHVLPNEGYLPWGGLWMRMQVQQVPAAYTLADKYVAKLMQDELEKTLAKKYPDKPVLERKAVAAQQVVMKWNTLYPLFAQKRNLKAEAYLEHFTYEQNGKRYAYPQEIDSFYFMRFARNLVEKGMYGDKEENGIPYDTLVTAPLGTPLYRTWIHPYLLAKTYTLLRMFDSRIPLMEAFSFFPMVLVTITLLLVFWLALKLQNLFAAFFSTLLFGLLGNGLVRTVWGNTDTDVYNLFFPVLILLGLYASLAAKTMMKQTALMFFTGLFLGLFARTWQGWWFVFDMVLGVFVIKLVYDLYAVYAVREHSFKNDVVLFVLFLFFTGLFVTLFTDFKEFSATLGNPFSYEQSITNVLRFDIWPNVYTTVSELQGASVADIITSTGGILIHVIVLVGLLSSVIQRRNEPAAFLCLVLLFWYGGMLYATTKGIRFALLLTVPIAWGFGIGIGALVQYIQKHKDHALIGLAPKVGVMLVCILAFGTIMLSKQVLGSYAEVSLSEPVLNDAWQSVLETIKINSPPNAIITSWWDYGHVFKYVANRPVTFDGGSQQRNLAYWVARMLTTANETEAVGILQMLDCGSTNAIEIAENLTNNSYAAVLLVQELVGMSKEEAQKYLEIKGYETTRIIPALKCGPPPAFVIVSGDMVKKAHIWGRFGLWNFTRALATQQVQGKSKPEALNGLQKVFGWNQTRAEDEYNLFYDAKTVNDYISPEAAYDANLASCVDTGGFQLCGNGLVFNTTSYDAGLITKTLDTVVYPTRDGRITTKKGQNQTSPQISALVIPYTDQYESILVTPHFTESLFTRLFFYQGHGLKHFKLFTWQPAMTGGSIFVYKVDWSGNETNRYPFAVNST